MRPVPIVFALAALLESLVNATSSPSPSSAPTTATQAPWNGITTYPTTVTRVWSRTLSDKAKASETAITVQTVTMFEPWPTSPNPENFPYTLLQTAVTARDVYEAATDAQGQVSATGTPLTATPARTVTSTWVLWNTSPTDLAVGEKPAGCKHSNPHNDQKCATPNLKQDTRCLEHGLTTACHSQCKIRRVEGMELWWCQKRGDGTSKLGTGGGGETREVAIGRVCTDSMGYYEQLLEPCDTMDHVHDCQPCNG